MAGVAELRAITVIFWQINLCLVLIRVLLRVMAAPFISIRVIKHGWSMTIRELCGLVLFGQAFFGQETSAVADCCGKRAALWRP
jgi:hypothetical protein